MSQSGQTTETKAKQQNKAKQTPQVVNQQSVESGLLELPVLNTAVSLQDQASQLQRLPKAQQQQMMQKIGRSQGNGHLQRLAKELSIVNVAQSDAFARQSSIVNVPAPSPQSLAPSPQPKLEVNEPDDQYEQEADAVADAVMRMPASAPPPPPDDDGDEPTQRNGSNGFVQAKRDDGSGAVDVDTAVRIQSMRGKGTPLPDGERQFFEDRMGADFSGVRIHTNSDAVETSQQIQAKAYTIGNDIAFNDGEYRPGTENGRHLLAHELTHTIQQGAVGALATPASPIGIQRLSFDDVANTFDAGLEYAGDMVESGIDAAGEAVDGALEMGADAFMAIIRTVAPQLAELLQNGPSGMLLETIEGGIQNWLTTIFGDVDISSVVTELAANVNGVISIVQGVAAGDPAACQAFSNSLDSIRNFVEQFMDNPVIHKIQATFATVKDVLQQLSQLILAPIFDTLMEVAGGIFSQVKGLATTISGWIGNVRDYMSAAWDWLMEQMGLTGGDEEGVWSWLQEQVADVWDDIKETLQPVMGPLQTVLGALLIFSPAGPVVIALRYGPQISEAIQWLWAHKDDPNIIENAHQEMGDTILPQLLTSLQGFGTSFQDVITELVGQITEISAGVSEFLGALTNIPLLNIAQTAVQNISQGIQQFASWALESLQSAGQSIAEIYQAFVAKFQPYIEVLTSIAMAIGNPYMIPVILAGWAWRALDDCYKAPIIDFLLDAVIGILEMAPTLPAFGLLWPLIKSSILGFLQGVRAQDADVKVKMTNKLAKIISGASIDFILGFVKGLLKGLWQGLTDPFVLMYSAVQGLHSLVSWLYNTASSALSDDDEQGDQSAIGERMQEMGGEVEPQIETISSGFMPALEEFFMGGEGITFEELMEKLGDAWSTVEGAIRGASSELAESIVGYFMQDTAEGAIGEGVGWLTGTIVFEVALAVLTTGTYTAASGTMKVLQTFARVLDWVGEAMGVAFRALSKLGGYLMDLFRAIGRMLNNAGGAVRTIMEAIQELAEKLIRYGQELLGMAVRGGDDVAGGVARGVDDVAGGAARTADGFADDALETVGERGARHADEVAEEAGEQGARRADDIGGTPDFVEAKAATMAAEKAGVPSFALINTLRARFSKHQFQAVFITPGQHRIVMRSTLDDSYVPNTLSKRQQYKKNARNLDDGVTHKGHSYKDHGAHTTPDQHKTRLQTGVTPGGDTRGIPVESSKFATHKAHVDACDRALDIVADPKTYWTKSGRMKKEVTVVFDMPGSGFRYSLDASGAIVTQKANKVYAFFKLNDHGWYDLVTMYPKP